MDNKSTSWISTRFLFVEKRGESKDSYPVWPSRASRSKSIGGAAFTPPIRPTKSYHSDFTLHTPKKVTMKARVWTVDSARTTVWPFWLPATGHLNELLRSSTLHPFHLLTQLLNPTIDPRRHFHKRRRKTSMQVEARNEPLRGPRVCILSHCILAVMEALCRSRKQSSRSQALNTLPARR